MKERSRGFLLSGVLILFGICLCLGGGSSRADALQVLLPRVSALILAVCALIASERSQLDRIKLPLIFLAVVVAIPVAQLVPLPQVMWGALPGRQLYVELGKLIGEPSAWRPISISPDLTVNSCLALLSPAAIIVAMATVTDRSRRYILIAVLVIIFLSVFLAALQQSDGPQSALRFYRPTNPEFGVGLFANRNHQALLMAIGIPVVAWWVFNPSGVLRNVPLRLAIGVALGATCLVGAALTASRSGLFLTLFGLIGALAIAWPSLSKLAARVRVALAAGFLLIASASFVLAFPSLARFSASAVQGDSRFATLPEVMTMFRQFFPVGIGFGAFERVFPRFESLDSLAPEYLNHVHNDLIELGIEAGLIGYCVLFAFISWWLKASIRVWRRASRASAEIPAARLGSVIIALCFLASLTDYPLRTPIIASLFALAAMMLHLGSTSGAPNRVSRQQGAFPAS